MTSVTSHDVSTPELWLTEGGGGQEVHDSVHQSLFSVLTVGENSSNNTQEVAFRWQQTEGDHVRTCLKQTNSNNKKKHEKECMCFFF